MCKPPCSVPSHKPHLSPGLTLRTLYRSSYTHELRNASGYAASSSRARPSPSAANAASAPSIPVFIALGPPLIRGTLRNPAPSPMSAPPGKPSLGSDCIPPPWIARAQRVLCVQLHAGLVLRLV